jgi:hypothetical protein
VRLLCAKRVWELPELKMAVEVGESSGNTEVAKLLSDFLLSAEVTNAYTLDEFKELFSLEFRYVWFAIRKI